MTARILKLIINHLSSFPSLESVGVEQHRMLLEKSAAMFPVDKTTNCKEFTIDSIPAALLTPEITEGQRTILYLHGGGFIAGSIKTHRDLAARLAKTSRADLLLINYRTAPEHRFPAALDDAFTAYQWLLKQSKSPKNIILAGDSAGGGLAVSLLVMLKNRGTPMPSAAVLISPWVDLLCKSQSQLLNQDKDPMLNPAMLDFAARLYAGKTSISDHLISPIHANLTGLCPMLIQTGTSEILHHDAVKFANRAKQAGVTAYLSIWKDMFHVWHYFARYLPQGRQALEEIGRFIQHH